MTSDKKIHIRVLGPFHIAGPDGHELKVNQQRSRAILAMLAISPGKRRERKWLQTQIWPDRPSEQRMASLRQCLADIRRALGTHRSCLCSDKSTVALDTNLVAVDIDAPENSQETRSRLLEGMDIPYAQGFEDWLRVQRSTQPISTMTTPENKTGRTKASTKPHLLLSRGVAPTSSDAGILSDTIVDAAATAIRDYGMAEIVDCRADKRPYDDVLIEANLGATLILCGQTVKAGDSRVFRFALSVLPTHKMIWSAAMQIDGENGWSESRSKHQEIINQAVNVAVQWFGRRSDESSAAVLCYLAACKIFALGELGDYEEADKLLVAAYATEPRGLFLAWRAFLRTFILVERLSQCRDTLIAEAEGFKRQALQDEPYNSLVLGLCAHVEMMVHRKFLAGYELAERSVELNGYNPIGLGCLGIAKSHLGRSQEGFKDTLRARQMAGSAPYRFQLDAWGCIAGVMAGNIDQAIACGNASNALAPDFAPPLRALSALHLLRDDREKSQAAVDKLRQREPDFSYEKLRELSYPASGLHRAAVLNAIPAHEI